MIRILLLLSASIFYAVNCAGTDYTNCSNDLRTLEKALYEPENYITLNKAFYPPGKYPSRLLREDYVLGDDEDNCTVTYYRSIGGFLLIQPPHIFQLTSLYFSSPAKSSTEVLKKITLHLPRECQPIVPKSNGVCSCHHDKADSYSLLDTLTQQVRSCDTHIDSPPPPHMQTPTPSSHTDPVSTHVNL